MGAGPGIRTFILDVAAAAFVIEGRPTIGSGLAGREMIRIGVDEIQGMVNPVILQVRKQCR